MNKKSSSKIITTGFMMLLIATGAALAAVLILSIGATVAEEPEAKERSSRQTHHSHSLYQDQAHIGASSVVLLSSSFQQTAAFYQSRV
jgi:ABC-type Fe2+-enterobactin transport system substrate-binding protein